MKIRYVVILVILFLIYTYFYFPSIVPVEPAPTDSSLISNIAHAFDIYEDSHQGEIPVGSNSTVILQYLYDSHYFGFLLKQPCQLFYFPFPNKVYSDSPILKPENVCFDVTAGINAETPRWIPVVFSTGYTIDYKTGIATKLPGNPSVGIAVGYKRSYSYWPLEGKNSVLIMPKRDPNYDVSDYHQLTP